LLPAFEIVESQGEQVHVKDGAKNSSETVWGTYLHGVFDNDAFRQTFLDQGIKKEGLSARSKENTFDQNREYDKLAQLVRENIDMEYLYRIINKNV
jgi:adenosylcobyric acid synthase